MKRTSFYSIEDQKKIRSEVFNGATEEQILIIADYFDQIVEKSKNEQNIFGGIIPIKIIKNILFVGYKNFTLDEILEFIKPRFEEMKDKLLKPHNIDAEPDLIERCTREYVSQINKALLCSRCGNPHYLIDFDAGIERNVLKLCHACYYRNRQ